MVTACEGAKESCFAEQSNMAWADVAVGIGSIVFCAGVAAYMWKRETEMTQIYHKRETLASIIFFVAMAVFLTLSYFLKATNYSSLFMWMSIPMMVLPYRIAKRVYPEKLLGIFPW